MQAQIDEILKNNLLTTFFQPIITVKTGGIYGYQAKIRGPEGALRQPLALFSEAKRYNKINELESLCRRTILREARKRTLSGVLFMGIDPVFLVRQMREHFGEPEDEFADYPANRIVLELAVDTDLCNCDSFVILVQKLKQAGYRFACDSVAPGNMQLRCICGLRPDFVKVDLQKIGGADSPAYPSVCALAKLACAEVITTGVQTAEQLCMLANNGSSYAQGDFLAASI